MTAVNLPDALIEKIKPIAARESRSVPKQIEFLVNQALDLEAVQKRYGSQMDVMRQLFKDDKDVLNELAK